VTPAKKVCERCAGRGVLPREPRRAADGTPDPLDFRRQELCPACGGAGRVPEKPPAEPGKRAGFIADHFAAS